MLHDPSLCSKCKSYKNIYKYYLLKVRYEYKYLLKKYNICIFTLKKTVIFSLSD